MAWWFLFVLFYCVARTLLAALRLAWWLGVFALSCVAGLFRAVFSLTA